MTEREYPKKKDKDISAYEQFSKDQRLNDELANINAAIPEDASETLRKNMVGFLCTFNPVVLEKYDLIAGAFGEWVEDVDDKTIQTLTGFHSGEQVLAIIEIIDRHVDSDNRLMLAYKGVIHLEIEKYSQLLNLPEQETEKLLQATSYSSGIDEYFKNNKKGKRLALMLETMRRVEDGR